MRASPTRSVLHALLSGLVLSACGGVPGEAGLAPAEETLGTTSSAMCSGLSVTSLTLSGISTYQGEMAGNGSWEVSTFANATRLEYRVDGVLRSSEERVGTYNASTNTYQGAWYFSATGISCGTHNFELKAYPMVIDSAGNRTVCWDSPRSLSQPVAGDACPALFTYTLYNPYFSGTYQYVDAANVTRYIFVEKNKTYVICARDGSVNGGPFTKGSTCQ